MVKEFSATEWRQALQGLTPGGSEFLTPDECTAYVRRRTQYPAMIIELRQKQAELVELLLSLEWHGRDYYGLLCCPRCGRHEVEGHNSQCRMSAVLAAAEKTI